MLFIYLFLLFPMNSSETSSEELNNCPTKGVDLPVLVSNGSVLAPFIRRLQAVGYTPSGSLPDWVLNPPANKGERNRLLYQEDIPLDGVWCSPQPGAPSLSVTMVNRRDVLRSLLAQKGEVGLGNLGTVNILCKAKGYSRRR